MRKSHLTESSLVIHWCCLEHGLIRTVAKGAPRPGSPFAGKLDLFYTVDFVWGRARKSDRHLLREVEVMEFRTGLQTSWLRVLCASYFVQLLEVKIQYYKGPLVEVVQYFLAVF